MEKDCEQSTGNVGKGAPPLSLAFLFTTPGASFTGLMGNVNRLRVTKLIFTRKGREDVLKIKTPQKKISNQENHHHHHHKEKKENGTYYTQTSACETCIY